MFALALAATSNKSPFQSYYTYTGLIVHHRIECMGVWVYTYVRLQFPRVLDEKLSEVLKNVVQTCSRAFSFSFLEIRLDTTRHDRGSSIIEGVQWRGLGRCMWFFFPSGCIGPTSLIISWLAPLTDTPGPSVRTVRTRDYQIIRHCQSISQPHPHI